MNNNIEILIPTFNEEGNIEKTIKDLQSKNFNFITILDAQSEDKTVEIAKNLGCKILIDPKKKNGFWIFSYKWHQQFRQKVLLCF